MTAPDPNANGHGHGHAPEQQPFMPDAHFAVQAQQEEIERLRKNEAHLNDRIIYLRALTMQAQAEGQHGISLARGEVENLHNDLAQRDAEIQRLRAAQAQQDPEYDPDFEEMLHNGRDFTMPTAVAAEVDQELDQSVSGWQKEPFTAPPPHPGVEEAKRLLAEAEAEDAAEDAAEDEGPTDPEDGVRVEQPDHEKIMAGATFGDGDPIPGPRPGIEAEPDPADIR